MRCTAYRCPLSRVGAEELEHLGSNLYLGWRAARPEPVTKDQSRGDSRNGKTELAELRPFNTAFPALM